MKLTKRQLKKLIEGVLSEEDTDPGDGQTADADKTDPDVGPNVGKGGYLAQQFGMKTAEQEDAEYGTAVDAYRNPDKPIGNMPHFSFGNEKGVTSDTKMSNIPSDEELAHVRDYQKRELGGAFPSVDDDEITLPLSFDDEDTEEAPYGTQASKEETEELYRFDDKTVKDPGTTQVSGIDYYDDDEDSDFDDDDDAPRTYGLEDESEEGMMSKLKSYFSKFFK